jgi:hypothetical protein
MRDDINRAVDTGILQNRQLTEWRKVLFAILKEFDAMPDSIRHHHTRRTSHFQRTTIRKSNEIDIRTIKGDEMSKIIQVVGFLIILAGLFIILSGFLNSLNQPVTTQDVRQYIDYDAQVVCYILENGNGISCLPMNEVNLSE